MAIDMQRVYLHSNPRYSVKLLLYSHIIIYYSHSIPIVFQWYSHYIPITFQWYSHYIPMTFPLYSNGIPIISPWHFHCTPMVYIYIIFPVHSGCIPMVFPLYSHCIPIVLSLCSHGLLFGLPTLLVYPQPPLFQVTPIQGSTYWSHGRLGYGSSRSRWCPIVS